MSRHRLTALEVAPSDLPVQSPPSSLFDRLMRIGEVQAVTGLGRNTIYTWMSAGKFPLPIDLGGCRVAWRASDIAGWIASRPRVKSVRIKRGVRPWEIEGAHPAGG